MVAQPEPLDIRATRTKQFLASVSAVAELYELGAPTREHFDETFAVRIDADGITLFADPAATEAQLVVPWNEIELIDHGVPTAAPPSGLAAVGAVALALLLRVPLAGEVLVEGILLVVVVTVPKGSARLKIPVPDEGGLPIPGAVAAVARQRPRGTQFQVPPELRRAAPRR